MTKRLLESMQAESIVCNLLNSGCVESKNNCCQAWAMNLLIMKAWCYSIPADKAYAKTLLHNLWRKFILQPILMPKSSCWGQIRSCTCMIETVALARWSFYSQDYTVLLVLLMVQVDKNIERHTADTIVSWPNPKKWVIVHTSDLIMIIRQSIYIFSQSSKEKWVNWKHTAPHIV